MEEVYERKYLIVLNYGVHVINDSPNVVILDYNIDAMLAAMMMHQRILILTTDKDQKPFKGSIHTCIPKYIATKGTVKASHLETVDIGGCNWSPMAFMLRDMLGYCPCLNIDEFGKGTVNVSYEIEYK